MRSQKKTEQQCAAGRLEANAHPYSVDGEVGRFSFTTYRLESEEGQTFYNSASELFTPLQGKEWYKTRGFKELAFIYGSVEGSYRRTGAWINRVRHQPAATPARTVQDQTEAEGEKIAAAIEEQAAKVLQGHNFTAQAVPCDETARYGPAERPLANEAQVAEAIERCARGEAKLALAIAANPVGYEEAEATIQVSIDDVGVKRQKERREKAEGSEITPGAATEAEDRSAQGAGQPKYVHNTIAHVEQAGRSYVLTGSSVVHVLRLLIAFLLHNKLTHLGLIFFVDGQRTLHAALLKSFSYFRGVQLILDWFHLEEKGGQQLSLALAGKEKRNQALEETLKLLWLGWVEHAIHYLREIDPSWIKNKEALEKMIGYLERHRGYIPAYAVRKELGLCNSSNRGEKSNDLVVSKRQKHNGMSWSKSGSVALASLTGVARNGEDKRWFKTGKIAFKLAA